MPDYLLRSLLACPPHTPIIPVPLPPILNLIPRLQHFQISVAVSVAFDKHQASSNMAEKSYSITPTPPVVSAPSVFAPYLDTLTSLVHPIAGPVYNTSARFHGWKESMGLVQPGTVENLTREVSREC